MTNLSPTTTKRKRPDTMAKIRKCVWPAPVYCGTFADGTQTRMSFWSPLGKPLDVMHGRRLVAATRQHARQAWRYDPDQPAEMDHKTRAWLAETHTHRGWSLYDQAPSALVSGYVEIQGERVVTDSMAETAPKPARLPPAKQMAGVVRDLLAYLEGEGGDAAILARAQEIARLAA